MVKAADRSEMSQRLGWALHAAQPLTRLFNEAGHRIYLVGGVVRDALAKDALTRDGGVLTGGAGVLTDGTDELTDATGGANAGAGTGNTDAGTGGAGVGTGGAGDLDCTTDARPEQVIRIVSPHASALWTQGRRFGTIGCIVDEQAFEITTHRADSYNPVSRKPAVDFGTDVVEDLYRRDFTVNAMAVDAVNGTLIDPCDGRADLQAGVLRTPLDPEISLTEDPLRMLRAARFLARLALTPVAELITATTTMSDRLGIVSAERIRDELQKLLLLPDPSRGLQYLTQTGLLAQVLPELKGLDITEVDTMTRAVAAVATEPAQRWAALFASVPVWQSANRLQALRSPSALVKEVRHYLTALPLLMSPASDAPSVRRLVQRFPTRLDSAIDFARALTAAPGNTSNVAAIDRFAAALRELRRNEDLTNLIPLDGSEVMRVLGLKPGPKVGQALDYLQELVLNHGPLSREAAIDALTKDYESNRQRA